MKYGNIKTIVDGIKFDSKREAAHYGELKLRQRAGEIFELELQPKYPLIVNGVKVATYIADFRYKENGATVVVDVKGMKTPVYNLKKRLMKATLGIDIVEVK